MHIQCVNEIIYLIKNIFGCYTLLLYPWHFVNVARLVETFHLTSSSRKDSLRNIDVTCVFGHRN